MSNSPLARIGRSIARWRRARIGMHELALLDDRMLSDIGITRAQIYSAVTRGRDR